MTKTIDFKKVAEVLRFDILGSFHLKTPTDFESLPEEERREHYQDAFDLFHDVCTYLQANLELDELTEKYKED